MQIYILGKGVEIDVSKVKLNSGINYKNRNILFFEYRKLLGLRYIAKLLLNSLWGKFAQKNIQLHSKIFKAENVVF